MESTEPTPHQPILSVFSRDITARKQGEEELETLYGVAQDLVRAVDLKAVSHCILSWTQRLLSADYVDLMVTDPGSTELRGVGNTVASETFCYERIDTRTEPSLVAEVFRQRQVVVIEDFTQSPLISARLQQTYHFLRTACGVPLLSGGQPVGSLCIGYLTRQEIPPNKLRLLQLLGDEVALAAERIRLAEALRDSEERLRLATDSAEVGIWHYYPQEDRLLWSPQFRRLFGLPPDDAVLTYPQFLAYVYPEDRQQMDQLLRQVLVEGSDFEVEYRIVWPDGSVHWIGAKGRAFSDGPGEAGGYRGVALDITARKQAEEALVQQAAELQRSNDELQQFARIVSHDLNTPLRTVGNFLQLLARRYQGKLDATADEYIAVAVGGAQRMQTLLADLLTYTRVGGEAPTPTAVDCEAVLARVLADLHQAVQESAALVTHDPLPLVTSDATQLGLVFQNLISNALKFRGAAPPCIHLSARQDGQQWVFSVRDNGIGIDPHYTERIFQVFQRLHSHQEYAGTGIGLAICKKIVERHGGRMWVESEVGNGATFYFTIAGK